MSIRRVCFQLQLKPGLIAEYTARHAAVWPEMLQALKSAGWNNYSLFLRPDGLLIGYFETDNLEDQLAAATALTQSESKSLGD
jgi:L-rhamnose mutarotase